MGQLPAAAIGDAYRHSIAWETLTALVDIENRMAGQTGEQAGAAVIRERFEQSLRDVETTTFAVPGWWRGSAALTLDRSTRRDRTPTYENTHQLIALPGSPAATEHAPLIDVGHGTPAAFEAHADELLGAIAMASSKTPEDHGRWIHRQEKYDAAADAGAVGFVFRNHVEGALPPTGSVGDADGAGPIPAVGVSRELGHRLVRHCSEGVAARLSVEARTEPTTSQRVSGVTGPDTAEEVLLTAHHDAHDIAEGANDNGAGAALVAEVGRLLATVEDQLETRVRCVSFGAEEIGLLGSDQMAATTDRDAIRAVVNLDGIGEARDLRVATHGFEEVDAAFEALGERLGAGVSVDDGIVPHSDHWPFVKRGVPGAMVSSDSGDGRGWGHTHADTLDKLDRRDFREIAVVLAAAVVRLAESDRQTAHVSPQTIADRAADRGRADIATEVDAAATPHTHVRTETAAETEPNR